MEDKRTEQYRQELKKFVMSHTEDVLKNPRSFIRYPFIDPGSVYDGNPTNLGFIAIPTKVKR